MEKRYTVDEGDFLLSPQGDEIVYVCDGYHDEFGTPRIDIEFADGYFYRSLDDAILNLLYKGWSVLHG